MTDHEILQKVRIGIDMCYKDEHNIKSIMWSESDIQCLAQDVSDVLAENIYDPDWVWKKLAEFLVFVKLRERVTITRKLKLLESLI